MQLVSVLLLMSCVVPAAACASDFQPVTCEGEYTHHLQGGCTDEKEAIFWCFTTKLVKTDRSGKVLKSIDVENHHGDLCYHQGRLYVALNLGKFNDPQGYADSWVTVYDAGDLSLVEKHKTPEVFHGAGGIAHSGGRFLVVGGLPDNSTENLVYEYDERFQFVKRHIIASGHTHLGIQTAAYSMGYWWFGCYGRAKSGSASAMAPALLKLDAKLGIVQRFEFDGSLGIVPISEGRFLVARGGTTSKKRHLGKLIPAVADKTHGLKIAE